MPAITIQSLELTDEQKVILAESFTKKFSEVSHVPEDRIYMFFDGYPLDSCAKGGKLFSKNPPQFGKGNFAPGAGGSATGGSATGGLTDGR